MNLCLIGYGAIARKHMEALTQVGGVHPRFLVGRRPEPTEAFATEWGFDHHTLDLDEALADAQVDAVVVTSPNEVHVPQAVKTLEAGKHLLLEIPMAMNLADARRVTELSRRVDRRLMVCHTLRTAPGLLEVRRRVATGELHLHQISCSFGILRRTNTTWTGAQRSWTDNILWHHGAHLVDLALWIQGASNARNVHCRFGPPHPTQGIMDLNLLFELSNRTLVSIVESYNISTFRWRAQFIGEEATLEWLEGKLVDGEGNIVVPRVDHVDLHDQDAEFVAAVLENRDPSITGEQILPCMQVLEAAQASAEAVTGER